MQSVWILIPIVMFKNNQKSPKNLILYFNKAHRYTWLHVIFIKRFKRIFIARGFNEQFGSVNWVDNFY